MTYEYYGYPPDWLDKYQAEIKKVTAADVNRVAAKYCTKINSRCWSSATARNSTSLCHRSAA